MAENQDNQASIELSAYTKTLHEEGQDLFNILLSYLQNIYEDTRTVGTNVTFMWDWEMIQEMIYPMNSQSVYSGPLWLGTQRLRTRIAQTADARIIIPEGTRREMLDYLTRILSTSRRTPDTGHQRVPDQFHAFQGHAEWQEVLGHLLDKMYSEQALDLLILLIDQFGSPYPFSPPQDNDDKIAYYEYAIGRFRTHQQSRNILADALNLASIDHMNELNESKGEKSKIYIITATRSVRNAAPHFCRDPLFYMFYSAISSRYPDVEGRRPILLAMISRLSGILNITESMTSQQVSSGVTIEKRYAGRLEFERFAEALQSLIYDPILAELGGLMARAFQSVNTAFYQATSLPLDLEAPSVRNISSFSRMLSKANTILARIGYPTAIDFELTWRQIDSPLEVKFYTLLDRQKEIVAYIERQGEFFSIYWDTENTLEEFIQHVEWMADILNIRENIAVYIRELQKPGVISKNINNIDLVLQSIKASISENKIALLRVDLGNYQVFFDPIHIAPRLQFFEKNVEELELEDEAIKMAVTFDGSPDYNILGLLYERSGKIFIFSDAFSDALRSMPHLYY